MAEANIANYLTELDSTMKDLTWKWTDLPITTADIKYAEDELNFKIPGSLIALLKIANGGSPSYTEFHNNNDTYILNSLLNIKPYTDDYLVTTYFTYLHRMEEHIIPFASDPYGNLFCINSISEIIYFFYHEIDADKRLITIANSLEEVINGLE